MTHSHSCVARLAMTGFLWSLAGGAFGQDGPTVDRDEATKAFEYLNAARRGPPSFSKEMGADLSDVKARPALKWDAPLAKVAEEKALDMAKRRYFDHVNPDGLGINVLIHEAGY